MKFIKRHQTLLRVLALLALLAFVLWLKVDLYATFEILRAANLWWVGLALLGFIPFLLIKAWRWQIILRDLGVPIPFRQAVRLYALGLGAGMLTPGNVGDAVKVAYFRERGFSESVISVVLDRIWDVLILLLLAGSGVFMFSQIAAGQWLMLALLIGGTLAALFITIHPRTQRWLFEFFMRLRKKQTNGAYTPATLTPKQVLVQFALSVLATIVVYARLFCTAAALGILLPPLPFVAAMSLSSIAQLVSVIPGGVGPREALLILLAPALGISVAQALALAALMFLLQLQNGIVGFGVWLLEKPTTETRQTLDGEAKALNQKSKI
ncbi:MAG: hypothetical protein HDKAJFGB_04033 [Anaerolineae bacterium]|nr:hypothetical protein [Anaerolineae bacterium]